MKRALLVVVSSLLLCGAQASCQTIRGGSTITGAGINLAPVPNSPQVSFAAFSSNNTAACSCPLSGYCNAPFPGLNTAAGNTGSQTAHPVAKPANTSMVDIHTLAGAGVKVLAHFMPWFKNSTTTGDHTQTKYNSNDSSTVHAQMNDMIARHFDGLAIDWYSSLAATANGTSLKVRDDLGPRCTSPQACPLEFSIAEDQGAIFQSKYHACAATDHACIVAAWETDLCYMNATFFGSSAYLKMNPTTFAFSVGSGNPVVFTFPPSGNWDATDMTTIHAFAQNLSANCSGVGHGINNGAVLIFDENSQAFTSAGRDGAYAWISPLGWNLSTNCQTNANNAIQLGSQFCWDGSAGTYLSSFYATGNSHPTRATIGSGNAGFDDNNASWGTNRVKAQRCGKTWLDTWNRASSSSTVTAIQVTTWNDYEEGSAIETGIATCYSVNTTLVGSLYSWTLSSSDTNYAPVSPTNGTIDHYRILFQDPVTKLTGIAVDNIAASASSYDLSAIPTIPSGTWNIYLQLVSKPSIQNALSAARTYIR